MRARGPADEEVRLRGDRHPNRFRWPQRLAALLGRIPDAAVAKRAGLNRKTVQEERRRRRIPPSVEKAPPVDWTSQKVRLLGKLTDVELARQWGIHPHTVMSKRRSLGIPPSDPSRSREFDWTDRSLRLIGKLPDSKVAQQLGISRSTVRLKRREMGIPSRAVGPLQWTPEMIALLGNVSDPQAARRLGISKSAVAKKPSELGIAPLGRRRFPLTRGPEMRELLRVMGNEELRRSFGIGSPTAAQLRAELVVPAPPPPSRKGIPQHRWTARERALVGKLPDATVAARVGVSPAAVKAQRLLLRRRAAVLQGTP